MIKHVHKNSLCCEAIVRRVPNGELLLVCQCGDVSEPAPLNRVYFWHSKDDGESWDKPTLLVPEDGRAVYNTEVSVIDQQIRCYITFHNGYFLNYQCKVYISEDSGYTWKEQGDIPCFDEDFVFIRGLLKLDNKTQLLPYQSYHLPRKEEKELLKSETPKRIWECSAPFCKTGVLISTDNGKTYIKGESIDIPLFVNGNKRWVWSEPSIVNLSNGDIAMLVRVDKEGFLYQSFSKDNGHTWSKLTKTNISNPNNKPKLLKMENGNIMLINTPNSHCTMEGRNPLELWISNDDMKTWTYKKTLVDFPGWCSYPDGFIENDTLYLAFEFNRHDIYFIKEKI